MSGAVTVEVLLDNLARRQCGLELLSPAADLAMKGRIAKQRREWAAAAPAPRKARAAPVPHPSVDAVVDARMTDPAVAETVARVRREAAHAADSAAIRQREIEEAAKSAARAERAALVAEARAIAAGPPVANPEVRHAAEIRGFIASELALLDRTVTPVEGARHVFGLDYDDAETPALEARREVARAREIGITMQNDTAITRVTAKREAHAADRTQILALGAQFPEQRSLATRLAADVECTYAVALDRVRGAERRALVLATARTIDAVDAKLAAYDLAHAKDVAREARASVDAAAARGERLSAAEAVAALEAK